MNNLLRGLNIYLIGMMGSGKSTIARLLAQKMGYGFVDTDDLIVKAANKSINHIFAEEGEAAFRQLESEILAQLCAYTRLSIATGGGIVLRTPNWSYLHHGLVVWLDVPVDLLYQRLAEDRNRPLLQDADPQGKLHSILEQRQALYAEADLRISISQEETPEEIATKIIATIPSVLKQHKIQEHTNNHQN
ncbi:MAG: shikimate kinase [Cyanobacteria bacterium P01_A01_bin.84]